MELELELELVIPSRVYTPERVGTIQFQLRLVSSAIEGYAILDRGMRQYEGGRGGEHAKLNPVILAAGMRRFAGIFDLTGNSLLNIQDAEVRREFFFISQGNFFDLSAQGILDQKSELPGNFRGFSKPGGRGHTHNYIWSSFI